jgi:hypothetical protein
MRVGGGAGPAWEAGTGGRVAVAGSVGRLADWFDL